MRVCMCVCVISVFVVVVSIPCCNKFILACGKGAFFFSFYLCERHKNSLSEKFAETNKNNPHRYMFVLTKAYFCKKKNLFFWLTHTYIHTCIY